MPQYDLHDALAPILSHYKSVIPSSPYLFSPSMFLAKLQKVPAHNLIDFSRLTINTAAVHMVNSMSQYIRNISLLDMVIRNISLLIDMVTAVLLLY